MEQWRDIPGHEGAYQVSDLGRVRSLDREVAYRDGRKPRFFRGRVVRPRRLNHGHLSVGVGREPDGSRRYMLIHRAALLAFVGPCPPGQEVRHLNGDPEDNRLENLAYGTRTENLQDRTRHNQRRLSLSQVKSIKARLGSVSQHALAREFQVSRSLVAHIAAGRSYANV